jgi:hypothetical protein
MTSPKIFDTTEVAQEAAAIAASAILGMRRA